MTELSVLQQAIRGRRSIGKVKDDPVPKELIEQLIEAAVWAPNHFLSEPWKFFVMTGDGRHVLGEAYADIAAAGWADLSAEEVSERRVKENAKALRSPVVIAAACSPSDDPRADRREELAAVHAAVQNLLLTAHELGLGAVWRTGAPAYHPRMKEAFGLSDGDEVVGLVFVGYPDMTPNPGKRSPASSKTVWLEG